MFSLLKKVANFVCGLSIFSATGALDGCKITEPECIYGPPAMLQDEPQKPNSDKDKPKSTTADADLLTDRVLDEEPIDIYGPPPIPTPAEPEEPAVPEEPEEPEVPAMPAINGVPECIYGPPAMLLGPPQKPSSDQDKPSTTSTDDQLITDEVFDQDPVDLYGPPPIPAPKS